MKRAAAPVSIVTLGLALSLLLALSCLLCIAGCKLLANLPPALRPG